jgi:site-specific DNA recombinase
MAVTVGEKNGAHGTGHAPVRAALYARVSSEEQKERQTIQTQVGVAEQYSQREGIPLVATYQDDGVSGTIPFEDREGGRRLLADARAKKFTVVWVYKVDRLGRADLVTHVARHHLETLGVGIQSLTEPFDTATPHGRFMFGIFASFAQLERGNTLERTRDGILRVARAGKWPSGRPPYGYLIGQDGKLVVRTEPVAGFSLSEPEIVKNIFSWVVTERASLFAVADRLNDTGIPTATVGKGERRNKKNARGTYTTGRWQPSAVAAILHREAYRGVHTYGGLSKKPEAERVTITQEVPAIIDPVLWQQAQEALKRNQQWAKRNRKNNYLLAGLLRCGFCGRQYHGATIGPERQYYICSGTMRQNRRLLDVECRGRRLPVAWIENLVWEELQGWIFSHDDLESIVNEALAEQEQKRAEWKDALARIEKDLGTAEAQRQQMLRGFRKGLLTDSDFAQQMQELRGETEHLQNVQRELARRLSEVVDPQAAVAGIRKTLASFRSALRTQTVLFSVKRQIVEKFVTEVSATIERGSALTPTLRQTIPMRADTAPAEKSASVSTTVVWAREPQTQRQEPTQTVSIRYGFPFLETKALGTIVSRSP